jgi:hypothetical protein
MNFRCLPDGRTDKIPTLESIRLIKLARTNVGAPCKHKQTRGQLGPVENPQTAGSAHSPIPTGFVVQEIGSTSRFNGNDTRPPDAMLRATPDGCVWGTDWPHRPVHKPRAGESPPHFRYRLLSYAALTGGFQTALPEATADTGCFALHRRCMTSNDAL